MWKYGTLSIYVSPVIPVAKPLVIGGDLVPIIIKWESKADCCG